MIRDTTATTGGRFCSGDDHPGIQSKAEPTTPDTQSASNAPVLMLYFDTSLLRMTKEMLTLEGIPLSAAHTEREALAILYGDEAKHVVVMDNLHLHEEGQAFLAALAQEPALRQRVRVVCMAAIVVRDLVRERYGDLVDEYLLLPFSLDQLLAAVTYP